MSGSASHEMDSGVPEWLHGHRHDPNPLPPSQDTSFVFCRPDGSETLITLEDLAQFPFVEAHDCLIVSTGHGTSGPFRFGGVRLADLAAAFLRPEDGCTHLDVVSADGFGNRVQMAELEQKPGERPILLATTIDGRAMSRAEGLVRLIVPSEVKDALRQVKWVARVEARI